MVGSNPMRDPFARHLYHTLVGLCGVVAVAFLGATSIAAQTEAKGPSELIRYLTYQADRPDLHGMVKGESAAFSCGPLLGEARDNRALTKALVSLGPSSLPALDDALDSFEARGDRSEVAPEAGWLLLAYARLKGSGAYPRLHRMYGNPDLVSYSSSLDAALALAFGFTSYLSELRATQTFQDHVCINTDGSSTLSQTPCEAGQQEQPLNIFRCDRGKEPRDSLDRLILAWQVGNRVSVEASLGPNARSALRTALKGRSWEGLQRELRSGASGRSIAIGYRFSLSGRWSEPDETLQDEREPTKVAAGANRFEIETQFYDSSGNACGTRTLFFLAAPEAGWYKDGNPSLPAPGPTEYFIDNSDTPGLLRLVFECSGEGSPTHPVR
jgi:hypothetical protein